MRGAYPAIHYGWCVRCHKKWQPGQLIGTVRRCLLHPPKTRRSMNSTQLGETVRLCASCARAAS